MLIAYTENGTPVNPGDLIISATTGKTWRYLYATRITTPGKNGLVVVNPPEYIQDGQTEMYASVFRLTVRHGISPSPRTWTWDQIRAALDEERATWTTETAIARDVAGQVLDGIEGRLGAQLRSPAQITGADIEQVKAAHPGWESPAERLARLNPDQAEQET